MKILVIVEGIKTENELFSCIFKSFGIEGEIVVASTNLYSLYDRMKYYNFECDVKDAVKELMPSDKDSSLLDQKFAYTYLVFDSELQNKMRGQRGTEIPIADLVEDNLNKLEEMTAYFTDETDPTIGRLYINYPMMESFRYCDSFADESYLYSMVEINNISDFKSAASKKKLAGFRIGRYTKDNFLDLIRLNIRKIGVLFEQSSVPLYSEYQMISQPTAIARKQRELIMTCQSINVLNTSLLMVVDYYGNRDGFYDDHIAPTGS